MAVKSPHWLDCFYFYFELQLMKLMAAESAMQWANSALRLKLFLRFMIVQSGDSATQHSNSMQMGNIICYNIIALNISKLQIVVIKFHTYNEFIELEIIERKNQSSGRNCIIICCWLTDWRLCWVSVGVPKPPPLQFFQEKFPFLNSHTHTHAYNQRTPTKDY